MNKAIVAILALATTAQTPSRTSPLQIFETLKFTAEEIAAVDGGRPVAKVLSWGGSSEVYLFGAIHVDAAASTYLSAARDVQRLNRTPGYLGVGEVPANATPADFSALSLEPDDVDSLKSCREGSCDVQLPSASIQAFRDGVDFSRPDAAAQANQLARSMLVRLLRSYQQGGNRALGEYRDKQHPSRVAAQFEAMVGRASVLPEVVPGLRRYLLQYPKAPLQNVESFFFWEKVDFGLKPTIRLNHGIVYRGRVEGRNMGAVAIKQLYATHYFHTALDVSVCVEDTGGKGGFYLLTLKGSQQEGLTGVKGSILRRVVVNKTQDGLERALASIKQMVEQQRPSIR